MDDFDVRHTAALAMAIGANANVHEAIRLFHSSIGSQTLAQSMASGADEDLRRTLLEQIDAKAQSIKQSIEAIPEEASERGVAILAALRKAETPVMSLMDELRNAPGSQDPVAYLQKQKLGKDFLKTLGLREGMSKTECQEVLSQHLESVLKEVGIDSGIRSLCKLAVHGSNHYRDLSSRLKIVSTVADGIANLGATLIQKTAGLLGKEITPDKTTKTLLGAAALLIVVGCSCCPPLAIAVGVLAGLCLLAKAVSFLAEKINENLAQSILKGQDPPWNQFCSDVFQKADERLADVVEVAGQAATPLIPGHLGDALRRGAAGEAPPPSAPPTEDELPADIPEPSASTSS
ncbi:MAG: hypothetical protein LBD54_00435 [Puniceicoccales bacterium]|nr:hypothetical protein [Puniceicoccales bacterium]